MKKYILNIFLFTCLVIQIKAQAKSTSLYMPLEFKQAYEKGTRKYDGSVSASYSQNYADYKMKVKIDPKKKILSATADIVYHNNSKDTLESIVFQAYADYYKKGAAKAGFFGAYNSNLESDGMVIEKLTINQEEVKLKDNYDVQYQGTNYRVYLKSPLSAGASVNIQVKWHFTIPGKGFERSGAIDPTSMFIGYWYPEISVYDDINGWDDLVYDASAEFYHDNSNYDVEIEVPKNYLVWGCVAPTNGSEIYPDFVIQNLEKAKTSETTVPIITEADLKKGLKLKSNIWKFKVQNFADFSFALSDHYIWDAASYTDQFGTYLLNAAYSPSSKGFSAVVKTEQEAVKLFHNQFPKYEFPYHHFTVFNGLEGGGMEFPGMANDMEISGAMMEQWTGKKTTDFDAAFGLSLHEMCHMYFPFIMGVNEKRYAWMDEGWATFSEFFIDGESTSEYSNKELASLAIAPMMVQTYTQPQVSSENSYTVGSFSYYSLYYLLGEDVFNKCMKTYIDRWNHKHPTPYDFFFTFNDASGQNLDWFWQNWYFDWGYPDVGIIDYKNNVLTIENLGGRAMAFTIIVTYADETKSTQTISPSVWKSSNTYALTVKSTKEVKSIKLNTLTGSDCLSNNNYWPAE